MSEDWDQLTRWQQARLVNAYRHAVALRSLERNGYEVAEPGDRDGMRVVCFAREAKGITFWAKRRQR